MLKRIVLSFAIGVVFLHSAAYGELIVTFKNPKTDIITASMFVNKKAFNEAKAATLAAYSGANVSNVYSNISDASNVLVTKINTNGKDIKSLMAELRNRDDVLYVTESRKYHAMSITPNDPYYGDLWGLKAIRADEVWDITKGSKNIHVAVVDSGSAYKHEDLGDNFETHNISKNFIGRDASDAFGDANGHGTHVSGTIGAVGNNSKGVVGVNWQLGLIVLRVLDGQGNGEDADVIAALDYLLGVLNANPTLKIASVNLSLGGYGNESPDETYNSDPLWLALNAIGKTNRTVICIAAGNEGNEVGVKTDYGYVYPASFKGIPNMLVVGAAEKTTDGYKLAYYSNYSKEYVSIVAPGSNIVSVFPGSFYKKLDGTSMATPHVAGVAALLMSAFPDADADEIVEAILNGANKNLFTNVSKYGFLDAKGAYDYLKNTSSNTALRISTESLPNGLVGLEYANNIKVKGIGSLNLSVSKGTLPNGLTIVKDGNNFNLKGKPTAAGKYVFTLILSNGAEKAEKEYIITIGDYPEITTTSLPAIKENGVTKIKMQGKGLSPLTWSLESTNYNAVLEMSKDGELTITANGKASFNIKVILNSAGLAKVSKTFAITIGEGSGGTPIESAPADGDIDIPSGTNSKNNPIVITPGSSASGIIEVGQRRATASVKDDEKKSIADSGQSLAVVLPEMKVYKTGWYAYYTNVNAVNAGTYIDLFLFIRSGTSNSVVPAELNSGYNYSFVDSKGYEVFKVPSDKQIKILMYLKEGTTYAPVLTAETQKITGDPDDDLNDFEDVLRDVEDVLDVLEEVTKGGNGGGGGGCNTGGFGIISLVLCAFPKIKKRK